MVTSIGIIPYYFCAKCELRGTTWDQVSKLKKELNPLYHSSPPSVTFSSKERQFKICETGVYIIDFSNPTNPIKKCNHFEHGCKPSVSAPQQRVESKEPSPPSKEIEPYGELSPDQRNSPDASLLERYFTSVKTGESLTAGSLLKTNLAKLLNATDSNGGNAIHIAVYGDQARMIGFLADKGVSLKTVDNRGRTAFYVAIENNKLNAVKALMKSENPSDIADSATGRNYYHLAAEKGNLPIFKAIVRPYTNKVHLETADRKGATPLSIAKEKGHGEIADYIESYRQL